MKIVTIDEYRPSKEDQVIINKVNRPRTKRCRKADKMKALTQWAFMNLPAVLEIIKANGDYYMGELSFYEESGLIDWEKVEKYQSMYRAGDSEVIEYQDFVDQKVQKLRHIRYGVTTEEVIEEELRWRRNDVPDNKAFWEQASSYQEMRKSPWLDGDQIHIKMDKGDILLTDGTRKVGIMDDRDFRERCVIINNRLQVVYDNRSEEDLRIMHKPEWLIDELDIDFEDAVTLCESWKRLGIRRQEVRRLINGYWDDNSKTWKGGLKTASKDRCRFYAEYFENLVNEIDIVDEESLLREHYYEISQKMIETGDWCLQHGSNEPHPYQQMKFIEESVLFSDTDDLTIMEFETKDPNEPESFVGYFGDEEIEPKLDVTATWKLYDGSETLDHDTICEIKDAGVEKIGKIVQRMYPKKRHKKIVAPAKWGYVENPWWASGWMTKSQTQQAWWYISDRREQLGNMCKKYLTKESVKILNTAKALKKHIATAYIATYCAGGQFNLHGKDVKWLHKPCENERFAIWAEWRRK